MEQNHNDTLEAAASTDCCHLTCLSWLRFGAGSRAGKFSRIQPSGLSSTCAALKMPSLLPKINHCRIMQHLAPFAVSNTRSVKRNASWFGRRHPPFISPSVIRHGTASQTRGQASLRREQSWPEDAWIQVGKTGWTEAEGRVMHHVVPQQCLARTTASEA